MTDAALSPAHHASPDRLVVTLFIAAALHAVLILGLGFNPEERSRNDDLPTLEITVVQRPSQPVEEADYLAAASQEGAGNTEERVRPQQESQEAAPPPPSAAEPQPVQPQLITTRDASQAAPQPVEETPPEPHPISAAELVDRSLEMLSLNREITQLSQAYSQRPREAFISARTREFKYANYMNEWVAKVERVGDLNYPDEARRRGISGTLRVQVTLNADGTVRDAIITRPSGHRVLDEAALRIVRMAAPFPPFPREIREDTDILHITRTWEFTSGHRLSSQ
jgi:periplasmic protein TonB